MLSARQVLILAICLLAAAQDQFAAPHRLRVYPNPSITILSIAQGPDGFLWLAAADGLYRFDGFRYEKIPNFPFLSAASVGFTEDQSLWCSGPDGLVRGRNNQFTVITREPTQGLAVYADQVFVVLQDGLARIGLDGSITRLKDAIRRQFTIAPNGDLWGICLRPERTCSITPSQPERLKSADLPSSDVEFLEAAPDNNRPGALWIASANSAMLMDHGREISRLDRPPAREVSRQGPLLEGRDRQLWFIGDRAIGLTSPIEFRDRAENRRYPPTAAYEDPQGHLWVAYQGRGLVEWSRDDQWQRWFPEDFAGEQIVQALRAPDGSLLVATFKNIYRLAPDGKWIPLVRGEYRYEYILPLDDGGFIASTREFLGRISPGGIMQRLPNISPEREQYRKLLRDPKGRIWITSKRSLFRLQGSPGALHLIETPLPQTSSAPQDPVDLEIDSQGTLWVAYTGGLAWLDQQDVWHRLEADPPVDYVRSFTFAGSAKDADLWATSRRGGFFERLHSDKGRWTATAFAAGAGYTPVASYFIKRDSRGWIWRGSPDGVFVSDGMHLAPNDWLHLNLDNGLAANETSLYGFFEDRDSTVWICGDEGLTHLHPDASWFAALEGKPQLTGFEIDGRSVREPGATPANLPSDTRTLRFFLGGLKSPAFRSSPIRYRLLPAVKQWQPSQDGIVEFRNLRRGSYSLEVAYAASPAVAIYPFQIGAWPVSWMWPAGFLAAAAVLIPVFRYTPALERTRFRVAKRLFLLRRWFSKLDSSGQSIPPAPSTGYLGQVLIDRYRIENVIARGGFSVVYAARHLARDASAPVAVKVLNRSFENSGIRDRFTHEVAALSSVNHLGVVRILDSWISPSGEPCLAMPLLAGPTMRAAMEQAPFHRRRTALLTRQIGDALSEVHKHGIVHRDLKPENVILTEPEPGHEQAVVIDFGTAGLWAAEGRLAMTTLMAGSFYYMAPERLTGHYSPASDTFSLGVIVLEMLTGKRLADLRAMYYDAAFGRELEHLLQSVLPHALARPVTDLFALAFNPHPQRRPSDIKEWSEQIAQLLERPVDQA